MRSPYRRILLVVVLTHLPLLFNDGIYWDSWMPEYASERDDLALTVQPFHDTGVPLVGYFYYAIGQLPFSVFLYKLIAFLSTAALGLMTYSIAARTRFLSDLEAQLVAITGVVWAAFRVHAVDVIAPYLFATALCVGVLFLWVHRPLTWRLRALTLALATLSVLLYSPLYVFYYGLVAIWFVVDRESHPRLWPWVRARIDFLVLPVALMIVTKKLFPPAAYLTENYSVKVDAALMVEHAHNFWTYGVTMPIRESMNPISISMFFVVLLVGFFAVGRDRRSRWRLAIANAPVKSWREAGMLFIGALALFGFGSLAFILVGKSPDRTFWWSRMALLVPWGVGLGFVAVTWAVRRARRPMATWLWLGILSWIAVGNWVQHQQSYLMLQARWISYQSLALNVKESHAFDDVTFLHVDEQPFIAAGYQDHTGYTWSVMFSHFGWGGKDKAVVGRLPFQYYCDEVPKQSLDVHRYALTRVNLAGAHADLVFANGPEAPYGARNPYLVQLSLVTKYYLHRFFMPSELPAFLRGVTTVERRPTAVVPSCLDPKR